MLALAEGEQSKVEADISPFQQNEVELAFNLSYIDAENVIGDFKRELHAKHRYWTEHRTKYVPYWTLFQASGYGKSRLIKEVAKDIPTLYLCLRPAASTGYPPQTEIIANFFGKKPFHTTLTGRRMAACLHSFSVNEFILHKEQKSLT